MSEASVVKRVMMEASKLGLRVFRNNTGVLKDINGRPVQFGLCVGSSDLIGWTKEGFFVAIECKFEDGKATAEQANFIEQVKKTGGFACIINDERNLKKELDEFYNRV